MEGSEKLRTQIVIGVQRVQLTSMFIDPRVARELSQGIVAKSNDIHWRHGLNFFDEILSTRFKFFGSWISVLGRSAANGVCDK